MTTPHIQGNTSDPHPTLLDAWRAMMDNIWSTTNMVKINAETMLSRVLEATPPWLPAISCALVGLEENSDDDDAEVLPQGPTSTFRSASKIHGMGTFLKYAESPPPRGTRIPIQSIKQSDIQRPTTRRHPTPMDQWPNHSCSPNCKIIVENAEISLLLLQKVSNGEELTVDYTFGGQEALGFECRCGAFTCLYRTACPHRSPLDTLPTTSPLHKPTTGEQIYTVERKPTTGELDGVCWCGCGKWRFDITRPLPSTHPGKKTVLLPDRHNPMGISLQQRAKSLDLVEGRTQRDRILASDFELTIGTVNQDTSKDPHGLIQCLQSADTSHRAERTLATEVLNRWLFLTARDSGASFMHCTARGSRIWIANTELYTSLCGVQGNQYNAHKAMRLLPLDFLTDTDERGKLKVRTLIFPIFKASHTSRVRGRETTEGHFVLACIKTRRRMLLWGDPNKPAVKFKATSEDMTPVKMLAKLWDDICSLKKDKNAGAQRWTARQMDIGVQSNVMDCGVLVANAISCIVANQDVVLPANRDSLRVAMLIDLFHDKRMDTEAKHHNVTHLHYSATAHRSAQKPPAAPRSPQKAPHNNIGTKRSLKRTQKALEPQHPRAPRGKPRDRITSPLNVRPSAPANLARSAAPLPQLSPEEEDLRDNTERIRWDDSRQGHALRIASLNLGIGGLKYRLPSILSWAEQEHLAVVHLQEARLETKDKKKMHNVLRRSNFRMISHCSKARVKPRNAVVTILRKEVSQYTTQLSLNGVQKVLPGRILAMKIDLPNAISPLFTTNCWLPDSGHSKEAVIEAYAAVVDLASQWTTNSVALMGDFNGAFPRGRPQGTGATEGDRQLRELCRKLNMHPVGDITQPSWESESDASIMARIDHCLINHLCRHVSTALEEDEKHGIPSDHKALVSQFEDHHGTWWPAKQVRSHVGRIQLDEFDNLQPKWLETVGRLLSERNPASLQEAERCMLDSGEVTLGMTGPPSQRKPFEDRKIRTLCRDRMNTRSALKYLTKRQTIPDELQWEKVRDRLLLCETRLEHIPPKITSFDELGEVIMNLKLHIQQANKAIRSHVNNLAQENLRQNCERKRNKLGSGKRSIQQAMGKYTEAVVMLELETAHPDTVAFLYAPNEEPSAKQIQDAMTSAGIQAEAKRVGDQILCKVQQRAQIPSVIRVASEHQWTITHLEARDKLVNDASNILSAIEFDLGNAGRARSQVCPNCRTNHNLTCLSGVDGTQRSMYTFCKNCKQCISPITDNSCYDNPPWKESIFSNFRKIPDPPVMGLRGDINAEELDAFIQRAGLRKAPGKGNVPAELWRHAPREIKDLLLEAVNKALNGEDMPAYWKGGSIRFLFKKHPATKLGNWRPITLIEFTYKILSCILTKRMNDLAEHYGILEETQEGFRRHRGTRRQFERVRHILRDQQRAGKKVYVAYVDFSNAFNAVDIEACMRAFEAFGFPDVDILRNIYKDAWFQACTDFGETAQIPLTRGTKQGDPASPTIFNVLLNILLRMIATSGEAVQTKSGAHNAGGYADDTVLFTNSISAMNNILNQQLKPFCDFTGLPVNIAKTEISAIDYSTGQALPTDLIRYGGQKLVNIPPNMPYKYLGIPLRLDLNDSPAIQYTLLKTTQAVDCLQNTCYTTPQLMMLFRCCVIPLFRYSAPLLKLTEKDLRNIDKQWRRAQLAARRLPATFSRAALELGVEDGGIATETALEYLLKELIIHIQQCASHLDSLNEMIMIETTETLVDTGEKWADAFSPTSTQWLIDDTQQISPYWKLQHWIRQDFRIMLPWNIDGEAWPSDAPERTLASTIKKLMAARSTWMDWTPEYTNYLLHMSAGKQTLIQLHRAGINSIRQLQNPQGRGLKHFRELPRLKDQGTSLLKGFQWITELIKEEVQHNTGDILRHTRRNIEPRLPQVELENGDYKNYDCGPEAYMDLIGLYWDKDDGKWPSWDTEEDNSNRDVDEAMGVEIVCGSNRKQNNGGIGVVVARTARDDTDPVYRAVFWNGQARDLYTHELIKAIQRRSIFPKDAEEAAKQSFEARWYAKKFESQAPGKLQREIEGQRNKLRGLGEFIACTVDGDSDRWINMVYRISEDQHTPGLFILHKQKVGVDYRLTDTKTKILLRASTPLRRFTPINTVNQTITDDEVTRLDNIWGKSHPALANDRPDRTTTKIPRDQQAPGLNRFAEVQLTHTTLNKHTIIPAAGLPPIEDPPHWAGGRQRNDNLKTDMSSMQTHYDEIEDKWLTTTLGGRTTIYSKTLLDKELGWYDKKKQQTARKDLQTHYHKHFTLDSRWWSGLRHRHGDISTLVHDITVEIDCNEREEVPHWILTSAAQTIHDAHTLYGFTTLSHNPGFRYVSKHNTLLEIEYTPTVAWIPPKANTLHTQKLLKAHKQNKLLTVLTTPKDTHIMQKAGLHRLGQWNIGEKVWLHANSWETGYVTPVAGDNTIVLWSYAQVSIPHSLTQIEWPPNPPYNSPEWSSFWSGDQIAKYADVDGTLVFTDGSCTTVQVEEEEEVRMGAGLAYRNGDEEHGRTELQVKGSLGSFVPEGVAIYEALKKQPVDKDICVVSDAAAILFNLYRSAHTTIWKDLSKHHHKEMLGDIIAAIQDRSARTTFVKVKAHRGQLLNEKADARAKRGCTAVEFEIEYRLEEEEGLAFQQIDTTIPINNSVKNVISKSVGRFRSRTKKILAPKAGPRSAFTKITARGVGRDRLASILKGTTLPHNTVRNTLKYLAGITPTNSWLSRFVTDQSAKCDLCNCDNETIYHVQTAGGGCPKLADAHTKAHDTIWGHVWVEILKEAEREGWTGAIEQEIQYIPQMRYLPEHARRRPDGYIKKNNKIILFDFTRGNGRTIADLDELKKRKKSQYTTQTVRGEAPLLQSIQALNPHLKIRLTILHMSYGAAIDTQHWKRELMAFIADDRLDTAPDRIIDIAIRQCCIVFTDVWNTRAAARKAIREDQKTRRQSGKP